MNVIVRVTRLILSLLALALIALGVLFWTGRALSLLPLHIMLGGLFVICMWLLSGLAFYARRAPVLAAVVFIWGLIVPFFGEEQLRLFPGSPLHWTVQALHLLVGIVAIGLAHALAGRILRPAAVSQRITSK